ncbi:MAG TPA: hypothetical protein DDY59_12785 [Lachnospiraceae bacterium]|nr:hypothetical protein [Lachnospiraceae bacterium]
MDALFLCVLCIIVPKPSWHLYNMCYIRKKGSGRYKKSLVSSKVFFIIVLYLEWSERNGYKNEKEEYF